MKKNRLFVLGCALVASQSFAAITTCPDPNTTSLQWGEPPAPWVVSPYSPRPQGEANTAFVRANILVAGLGRGVMCTYKNSLGKYAIWWEVLVKIPSRNDYRWIDTLGGFVCTESLTACEFSAAS